MGVYLKLSLAHLAVSRRGRLSENCLSTLGEWVCSRPSSSAPSWARRDWRLQTGAHWKPQQSTVGF